MWNSRAAGEKFHSETCQSENAIESSRPPLFLTHHHDQHAWHNSGGKYWYHHHHRHLHRLRDDSSDNNFIPRRNSVSSSILSHSSRSNLNGSEEGDDDDEERKLIPYSISRNSNSFLYSVCCQPATANASRLSSVVGSIFVRQLSSASCDSFE